MRASERRAGAQGTVRVGRRMLQCCKPVDSIVPKPYGRMYSCTLHAPWMSL